MFHVSLLRPYTGTAPVQPDPGLFADAEDQPRPERILGHRDRTRGTKVVKQYLVSWSGCGPDHITWEPEPYLPSDLVREYWRDLAAKQATFPQDRTPAGAPLRRSTRVDARGMPHFGEVEDDIPSEGEESDWEP